MNHFIGYRIFLGFVIVLGLALALLLASDVSQAQSPTPTPTRVTVRAPSDGNYKIFLPGIMLNANTSTPIRKGVAVTYNDCASVSAVQATWEFSWSRNPPNCAGIDNVPMIWDGNEVYNTLGGNSQWIMGFNEPDSAGQANMSPEQAAMAWRQIEQKYPTRKLLSPGPSGANPGWLVNFRDTYIALYNSPPRLNGLQVHCYAWYSWQCVNHAQQFVTWATSWNVTEIWVAEFSFSPTSPSSPTGALQEMQTFINWMDSTPKITRYAWFASTIQGNEWWLPPTFNTPLVQWGTTQPTTFGTTYIPYH